MATNSGSDTSQCRGRVRVPRGSGTHESRPVSLLDIRRFAKPERLGHERAIVGGRGSERWHRGWGRRTSGRGGREQDIVQITDEYGGVIVGERHNDSTGMCSVKILGPAVEWSYSSRDRNAERKRRRVSTS